MFCIKLNLGTMKLRLSAELIDEVITEALKHIISDNGNGIDEKDKNKIFEIFYTANKGIADCRRSLGLALCKSIIIAHGGKISVLDNKPKGAIFRFTLPEEEVILNE